MYCFSFHASLAGLVGQTHLRDDKKGYYYINTSDEIYDISGDGH